MKLKNKLILVIALMAIANNQLIAQSSTVFGFLLDNSINQSGIVNHKVKLTGTITDITNTSYFVNDSMQTDSAGTFNFDVAAFNISTFDSAFVKLSTTNCSGGLDTLIINLNADYFAPHLLYYCEVPINCSANVSWLADSIDIGNVNFSSPNFIAANSWSIDFGDGVVNSNSPTFHHYSNNDLQNGVTAICTINFADGCTVTQTFFIQQIIQQPICAAGFTYLILPTTPPTPITSIQFTNTCTSAPISMATFSWNFGDGDTSSTPNPIHTYTNAGIYNVCLTMVTNTGCNDTYCNTIVILDAAQDTCTSNFTFTTAANFSDIYFDGTQDSVASSTYTGSWTFGDSTSVTNNIFPSHTFAASGTYNVCYTASYTNGCVSTSCQNIVIFNPTNCNLTFTTFADSLNSNDVRFSTSDLINPQANWTINYSINFGDSTFASGATTIGSNINLLHTYDSTGVYYACFTTTNSVGCTSAFCDSVNVIVPLNYNCDVIIAHVSNDSLVELYANANGNIISYQWSFGDGSSDTTNVSYNSHVYNAYAEYTICVQATATNGCVSTSCDTITIFDANNISGYLTVNNQFLDSTTLTFAKVYLLKFSNDSINENDLEIIDSTFAYTNGWHYQFTNLPYGEYLTYATFFYANGTPYFNAIPAYAYNALTWQDSDTLSVASGGISANINCALADSMAGNGTISGFVNEGPTRNVGLANVKILLFDNSNHILKYTNTNTSGSYSFGNLSVGIYHVYPEIFGIATNEAIVEITAQQNTIAEINFALTETQIYYTPSSVLELKNDDVTIFPNPAKEVLNLKIKNINNLQNITIYNTFGEVVISTIAENNIDISTLSKGIYLLIANTKAGVYKSKFVKE